ncbi:MAG: hypothetical protein Q7S79_03675 [bacterium]|nr:hypothetical protein [bacterium]
MKRIGAIFVFVFLLAPLFTFAHRSGCHRWHSCPSDTGSYICGDLGYTCKYPTYPKSGGVILPNNNFSPINPQIKPNTNASPTFQQSQEPSVKNQNSSFQASMEQIKIQALQKQINSLLQQIADLQAQLIKPGKKQ